MINTVDYCIYMVVVWKKGRRVRILLVNEQSASERSLHGFKTIAMGEYSK